MLGSASAFPWWLWLLAGLWGMSLVLRRRLTMSPDWRRSVDLFIVVYTGLLIYATLQSATSAPAAIPVTAHWGVLIAFWCGAGFSLGGGLLALLGTSGEWVKWGHLGCMTGLALLAARWEAYELASLCLLVGGVGSMFARPESDFVLVGDRIPARDLWVIGSAVTMVCVLWLGLLQYALRQETQRPGPSRWYTAIPSVESAARARRAGAETSTSPALTWSGLSLAGALVWCMCRHRQSTNTEGPDAAAGAPDSGMISTAVQA